MKHSHQELPFAQEDADMLTRAQADACLNICIGLQGPIVVAVGTCQCLMPAELSDILLQAAHCVRLPAYIEDEDGGN